MAGFMLEIVTPDRKFFEEEVDMIIVRGVEGELGILKGMSPLVTPLGIGKIQIKQGDKTRTAAVAGGYIEVTKEKSTIVSDAAWYFWHIRDNYIAQIQAHTSKAICKDDI